MIKLHTKIQRLEKASELLIQVQHSYMGTNSEQSLDGKILCVRIEIQVELSPSPVHLTFTFCYMMALNLECCGSNSATLRTQIKEKASKLSRGE